MKFTGFRCTVCGRISGGRCPRGGDGSLIYPRRHKINRVLCEGSTEPADWITVDGSFNAISSRVKLFLGVENAPAKHP